VRRLLVGFLHLSLASEPSLNSDFFDGKRDSALIHAERRSELRVAMGLEENRTRSSDHPRGGFFVSLGR